MPGNNVSSADNQQERIETCGWVVGFVDGEGSFLVNIFKSPKTKMGWQVFPEFNVAQTEKGIDLLYRLRNFFGCGYIYAHRARNRKQNKWDPLYKYCVRSRVELREKIIPFFMRYPPKSVTKRKDFRKFVAVIEMIERKEHLTIEGMRQIAKIVESMTHRKPFQYSSAFEFLSSSETIRQAKYSQH
jgi:hypothetical protein